MYEKWCIFQDWTPFLKVRDSANREIFIGTTLVLKSYMYIIAAELYSSPSTSAWGKLGTLLPSMAAFPRWSRMPSLPQRWAMASPSSCPVCLASALPSFLTSLSAHGCQPPKDSATRGRKTIPCCRQSQWDRYRIFRSGPRVPGCYNGKIQSFFAESGLFPDHFFNFSGLLFVIFIQIVKKGYKM